MIRAMRALTLLLATLAMAPAYAQTYKWTDERGVVNYSNVPPASSKAKAAPIEDRVSVVSPDPNLAAATAAAQEQSARNAEYAHREWLARQQGMQQAQTLATLYAQPADYLPSYWYGYGAVPVAAPRYVRAPARRVVHHGSTRRF